MTGSEKEEHLGGIGGAPEPSHLAAATLPPLPTFAQLEGDHPDSNDPRSVELGSSARADGQASDTAPADAVDAAITRAAAERTIGVWRMVEDLVNRLGEDPVNTGAIVDALRRVPVSSVLSHGGDR